MADEKKDAPKAAEAVAPKEVSATLRMNPPIEENITKAPGKGRTREKAMTLQGPSIEEAQGRDSTNVDWHENTVGASIEELQAKLDEEAPARLAEAQEKSSGNPRVDPQLLQEELLKDPESEKPKAETRSTPEEAKPFDLLPDEDLKALAKKNHIQLTATTTRDAIIQKLVKAGVKP